MMDAAALLPLLQLSDSAFPSGAFSHSYGLETYTQAGIVHDDRSLLEFLSVRLRESLACCDLVFLREAHDADFEWLCELDERLSAMMPVRELREASHQVGRRFLRSALPLYGGDMARRYFEAIQARQCSGHQPLAYSVIFSDLGAELQAALLSYTANFVMGQALAAVKLLNLGQTRIQAVIHQMQPVIDEAVARSCDIPLADCRVFMPALEIRAMQHEYLFRRLFIS